MSTAAKTIPPRDKGGIRIPIVRKQVKKLKIPTMKPKKRPVDERIRLPAPKEQREANREAIKSNELISDIVATSRKNVVSDKAKKTPVSSFPKAVKPTITVGDEVYRKRLRPTVSRPTYFTIRDKLYVDIPKGKKKPGALIQLTDRFGSKTEEFDDKRMEQAKKLGVIDYNKLYDIRKGKMLN
jgi:hypothetical protein